MSIEQSPKWQISVVWGIVLLYRPNVPCNIIYSGLHLLIWKNTSFMVISEKRERENP
jgi:hypothetical protein